MIPAFQNLKVDSADRIATITVSRPEVRNALDLATVKEFHEALRVLSEDESLGVLIITGAGDSSFVAGADIRDIRARTTKDALAGINTNLFSAVERFPRPTIAAVNGYALGGGCELALACDIRIASEKAKFGLPELGLGIIPGAGGTQRLPRIIGWGRAKHLILTGEVVEAARAEQIGLVSRVVPPDQLMTAAREIAGKIVSRGPIAARLAKLTLNAAERVDLDSGLLLEMLAQTVCFGSEDKVEGTTAFLEKRPAKFTGK